jgi:acid phosphatase
VDTVEDTFDAGPDADVAPEDGGVEDTGTAWDAASDVDALSDAGTDADGGLDSDTGSDAEPLVVRFVAFGDWGGAVSRIERAADAMWAHCQTAGCDFVLGLGDNFYNDGVTSVDDPQWEEKYEEPFADWTIPFFMTLGNHDHHLNADAQVEYSLTDDYWTMPARYYDLVASPVHFVALDTTKMNTAQALWLGETVAGATEPWRIVFGHHPWRSNGVHGDASTFLWAAYEWAMCHRADVVISGHDHDLQHVAADCNVDQIVSGAAERLRDVEEGENTYFARSTYGFAWFEVTEEELVLEFYDLDLTRLYRYERTRPERVLDCDEDGYCAMECASDPDCSALDCGGGNGCEIRCSDDPDCFNNCACDFYFGICEPLEKPSLVRCGCDPACRGGELPCVADGHCDSWCPAGADPDC